MTTPWPRLAPLVPLSAVPLAVAGPSMGHVDVPWLLLGVRLEVDPIGRALLLVAALLYAAALAGTAQAVPQRRPSFTAFLLVCFAGNVGVLVAADTVTFYLSFAVMGFGAYGLVIHDRSATAFRAGRVYLTLTVLGEAALVSALLLVVHAGGTLVAAAPAAVAGSEYRDLIVALLIAGFGVKAGLVPLHVWLPLAHPAAPAPASAVLSGCMVKAGLVGLLRFLPLGEAVMPRAGAMLGGLALVAAFGAVAVGLTQRDPKAALAYSTVSQMGFHLVLVAVALTAPEMAAAAVAAAVVYAVHHGVAKGALFLGVAVHKAYGGSRARHLITAGLAVSALALAGAPFTTGAAAKYTAKEAIGDAGVAGIELVTALPLVAVGTTLLLARFLWLLPEPQPSVVRVGAPGLLASWTVLLAAAAPLTWFVAPGWAPAAPSPSTSLTANVTATWPILLALVILGVVARVIGTHRLLEIPPGDILVAVTAWRPGRRGEGGPARREGRRARRAVPPRALPPRAVVPAVLSAVHLTVHLAVTLERRLVDWRVSGAAVLGVLGVIIVAVLLR